MREYIEAFEYVPENRPLLLKIITTYVATV